MDSLTDTLWDVGLSGLRGGFLPAKGLGLPVNGTSAGNSLPKRSYCIEELANGGIQIVNPPDFDDDRMESRTFNA